LLRPIFRSELFVTGSSIVLVAAASFAFVVGLQLYSLSHPERSGYSASPADSGAAFEPVRLVVDGGLGIDAWFVPAARDTGSAILAVHGYGSNKAEVWPRLAFLARSHSLLLLDLRYFGGDGAVSTAGIREDAEVTAALQWLRERGFRRFGVYGMSIGGGLALEALATQDDVRCAVVESPVVDLALLVRGSFRSFGALQGAFTESTLLAARALGYDYREFGPGERLASVSKPLLALRPDGDTVTDPEQLTILAEAQGGNPAFEAVAVPGKRFGDLADDHAQRLTDFYGDCLR
jgi:dipeptidyl aminopeptidase/acylaminoacyl peptidase